MAKTVAITGAGSGIGQATAKVLADLDYSLILLGRNLDRLEQTRRSLKAPDAHRSFSCDVRQPEEIRDALIKSGTDSLYAAVANAGVGGENRYASVPLDPMGLPRRQRGAALPTGGGPGGDRWREVIDTNLSGSYYTARECLPYLKQDGNGFKKLIFISSILARLGVPGYSAYCASKAGLLGLTRSLAAELAGDKILVNAICPGWVDTAMARQGLQAFADALSISPEEAYQNAMKPVPLGKMSEPEEIANFAAFLISDAQTSITGQTFDINNGALMP
ncbi:MAG: SDR family oxidoreductase [Nitrospinae bacterium]|nr:SDR family oxidoreductase [Nitrospinota bacterium]